MDKILSVFELRVGETPAERKCCGVSKIGHDWLSAWWFGTCFIFHILGMSSSQPTNIFQDG